MVSRRCLSFANRGEFRTRAVLESGAREKTVVRLHDELLGLCQGYEVGAAKLNVETSSDSASALHFEPIFVDFETLDFRIERSRWEP